MPHTHEDGIRVRIGIRIDPRLGTCLLALTIAMLWPGCDDREQEQIRTYRAPKPPPAAGSATGVMQWDRPQGWRSVPNPEATGFASMRLATLAAGEGDNQIEVVISQLGGDGGGLIANINRWRGQVGLEPSTDPERSRIEARGAQGIFVDLAGSAPEGSSAESTRMLAAIFPGADRTWFIKTTATRDRLDAHFEGFMSLCRSVRFGEAPPPERASQALVAEAPVSEAPESEAPASGSPQRGGPTWSLPNGWERDEQPATMSLASFRIRGGGQEARVTITPLNTPPNLLGNVNRWRGQVNLGPQASLSEDPPKSLPVDGQPGYYVDLKGAQLHTLGVIATRGKTTWFYKLSGPDPLVSEQTAAFESFVGSIRFEGDSGA
ncbi:MAG: hypothetical protein O7D94_13655 [Planctomycetota bacterium]|nr:hypothetical protein [Planctomycetota bacterium]